MAHIETFDALAEYLCPKLLDTSEQGLVPQGFFAGGKPARENWKQVLNAVYYAPLMRASMREYLAKPPEIIYDHMWRYTSELEFMQGYIEHFGHPSLPATFNPEQDLTHLLMAQRVSHKQVIDNFATLERNPHFLVTIAHMQDFFVRYLERLEPCVMEKAGSKQADKSRITQIFSGLKRVMRSNQALFVSVMMQQLMAVHERLANQDGRPVGDMTLKDFMAFDRYIRSGKMFVQKGDVCPWSDAYRLGMQGKTANDAGGFMNISGIHLWYLHQHVAPAAEAMRSELRQDVLRAGMLFSQKLDERSKMDTCPHRPASADDVLIATLMRAIG